MLQPTALCLFLLLPLLVMGQFDTAADLRIREIFSPDAPSAPVFRSEPLFMMGGGESESAARMLVQQQQQDAMPEGLMRFMPTATIRITPSKEPPTVEESLDTPVEMVKPHEWSKMTVFVKTGANGRSLQSLNDQFAKVFSTWIRTTKGRMGGGGGAGGGGVGRQFPTTTPTPSEIQTTTPFPPPPPPSFDVPRPQMTAPSTPPPLEFVNREDIFTTKPPKTSVLDARMPTIVEGWPLGGEFIERNPLIDEDDGQYPPPQSFEEMLRICPMYPETSTMFVHQIVKRDYSAGFETRVQCRCGEGSHESFFARKAKPLLTDQGPSLDPNFLKSDLIVGRFSCAFPGNICVVSETGVRLRSMDWGAQVYPAVGSGGGWANSYILLMENGTRLEDVDSGKVYLGRSQFDDYSGKRKSRLEHSYLRIKSISCDGCTHTLACQR